MEREATVVFDGLLLRPEGPIDMKPHTRYRIVFDEILDAERPADPPVEGGATMSDGRPSAWDVLEGMIGTVEMPPDWSVEHDHYIRGTPKRWQDETP